MARLTCALGPDNAGRLLLETLASAQHNLDATLYELGDAYCWALRELSSRGVDVKLVVDPRSDPTMRARLLALSDHGVKARVLSLPHSRAHAKVIVVDGDRVALGSGNLNERDAPLPSRGDAPRVGTREWWVAIDGAPTLSAQARRHVLRNWRSGVPVLGLADPVELVAPPVHSVSPEIAPLQIELSPRRLHMAAGGAGVRAMELAALSGVKRRALVIAPYVSVAAPAVAALLGAMTAQGRRGLDVRLLLGEPPATESDLAMLAHLEIPVRALDPINRDDATAGHAKGVVCDDTVIVGSANWSEPGMGGNDEAALAIDHAEAAGYYAAAFDRDWKVAEVIAPVD